MKIKIYNKKAPLAIFQTLNQKRLDEMIQSGIVYNKGLTGVLSESLKQYENLQNAVNFDLLNFNPKKYFKLELPELKPIVLEKVESNTLENKDSDNDVSLLDFSDYNIDLRDIKVINKFNARRRDETIESESDATLGEIIDISDENCINLLEGVNEEAPNPNNLINVNPKKFCNSDLHDFKLFRKKSENQLKENREIINDAHAHRTMHQFGRNCFDFSSIRSRKSSDILTSKNMGQYKNSGVMTPLMEYKRNIRKNNLNIKESYDASECSNSQMQYYSRTKNPNPTSQINNERLNKSSQQFLSPAINGENKLPFGECFKTGRDFKSRLTSNCNSGARTPIKFGKSASRKDLNAMKSEIKSVAGLSSRKKKNRNEYLNCFGSGQKMRFSSKSPLFAKLRKNILKSNKKERSKSGYGNHKIVRENDKKYFSLSDSSKNLLATKPSRSTIPAKYHQQLIKLIDGYGSNFDFSDSRKFFLKGCI